jgi:transposase
MTQRKKKRGSWQKLIGDSSNDELTVVHPNAAGIDIGSAEHWVAVPPDRGESPVRSFGALTPNLQELVAWLKQCRISTVAMESTGVYWVPLYELLEAAGIDVQLVNTYAVRSVPGRKSDVMDCQWLLKLHTFGLLRGSFRPTADIASLRSYMRQRDTTVSTASQHIQRMQKALTLMNIQLHIVISDITGLTGMSILRDIVKGERRPEALAQHRHHTCRADEQTIAEALTGNYQPEHLLSLQHALEAYELCQKQIDECDQAARHLLEQLCKKLPNPPETLPKPKKKTQRRAKGPKVDYYLPAYLLTGVDLTAIPGISEYTAIALLSEIGTDMSRFPSAKHFGAWLRLAPGAKISGGKVLSARTLPSTSRAASLLRMAAVNAGKTKTALGAFYRKLTLRRGSPRAVVATAYKIARIIYTMLATKLTFVDAGEERYNEQERQRMIKHLTGKAKNLGFSLVRAEVS